MKQEHFDSHPVFWGTFLVTVAVSLLLYAIVIGASVCDLTAGGYFSCA